jgi:hypothetical protein
MLRPFLFKPVAFFVIGCSLFPFNFQLSTSAPSLVHALSFPELRPRLLLFFSPSTFNCRLWTLLK